MMNADYRLKRLAPIFASLFLITAGCGGAYRRASRAENARDFETAMREYKEALNQHPTNSYDRLKYEQARFAAAFVHFQNGRRAFDKNDLDTAKKEFQRTLEIDPTNDLAEHELEKINAIEVSRQLKQPEPQRNFEDMR